MEGWEVLRWQMLGYMGSLDLEDYILIQPCHLGLCRNYLPQLSLLIKVWENKRAGWQSRGEC